ncbi:Kp4-domain-containing protein [Mycena latifolia]|nr:Kp4-domain-containing protein [Mycena latifolia]
MHFRILRLAVILATTSAVPVHTNVSAFGINCEGSMKCRGQPDDTASRLVQYIDGIDGGRLYSNGEHIACRLNVCAFLQGEQASMKGGDIRTAAHAIKDHGCTVCGSVPTSAGNNVAYGELTFNFVNSPSCGDGLC